jgi:hypothetical protein
VSRELLILAILEEAYGVKMCYEHPEIVRYEEPECPCCRMEYEFKASEFGHNPLPRLKP